MKNIIRRQIFFMGMIALIVPFFASCATDDKFAYTYDQIGTTNKKIAAIQETIDANNKSINESISNTNNSIEKKISAVNSNQAAIRLELDQLKKDLSQLSGRVEETESLVQHSMEKDLTSQDGLRTNVLDMSLRVEKLEALLAKQNNFLGIEENETVAPAQDNPAGASGEGQPVVAGQGDEKSIYDSTMALYKEDKFEEALNGFKGFLEKFPKSPDYADNAQYWIGECYMELKDYPNAILAFEEVIKKYTKSDKVPGAILKQAVAFLEYGDKTSCTARLKDVIKKFPSSTEAKVAKKKLEMMK